MEDYHWPQLFIQPGWEALIHFLATTLLAKKSVSCKNIFVNLSISESGNIPNKLGFGFKVRGEPIVSWRKSTICSLNHRTRPYQVEECAYILQTHQAGVGVIPFKPGHSERCEVRSMYCRIYICVNLSESFGDTALQVSRASLHSSFSISPTSLS